MGNSLSSTIIIDGNIYSAVIVNKSSTKVGVHIGEKLPEGIRTATRVVAGFPDAQHIGGSRIIHNIVTVEQVDRGIITSFDLSEVL